VEPNQDFRGLICEGANHLPTKFLQDAFRDQYGMFHSLPDYLPPNYVFQSISIARLVAKKKVARLVAIFFPEMGLLI
jgi:hypothetical protein